MYIYEKTSQITTAIPFASSVACRPRPVSPIIYTTIDDGVTRRRQHKTQQIKTPFFRPSTSPHERFQVSTGAEVHEEIQVAGVLLLSGQEHENARTHQNRGGRVGRKGGEGGSGREASVICIQRREPQNLKTLPRTLFFSRLVVCTKKMKTCQAVFAPCE